MVRALEIERQTEQGSDSRSLSDAGAVSAAISRAFAPPRSPISARSRSGCRSPKRRCWWRCRNRRKPAGSTAFPSRARGARPRARSHGRGASHLGRRRAPGEGRSRAAPAQADADPGAAFRRSGRRRRQGCAGHQADAGCGPAEGARTAGARPRDRAGTEYFGGDHRRRQCQRRRARPGRLGRIISTTGGQGRWT